MRTIQFREAICEAMSEEMRRDESIYLMGEEDKQSDYLDRSCEANLQGKNRIERAYNFFYYVKKHFPKHNHRFLSLDNVDHDNFKVYSEGSRNVEREWGWDTSDEKHITLNEIGMVFYDDDGKLWKYFVTEEYDDHENKNGLY